MVPALQFVMAVSTAAAVIAFVAAFSAHILLQFYIDHERVRDETGEPGWKIFGSVLAPVEFYKPPATIIWKIQRVGLSIFVVSVGVIVVVFLLAACLGISLNETKA